MTRRALNVAVVGHTNTGKTSLLRTLTRDVAFGEVSSRPATTRVVEAATLFVNEVPAVTLFDTPGLENSTGLLDHLDAMRRARGCDWTETIQSFVREPREHEEYKQEVKALRQVIDCDVSLYVIDARDRVLGKHRDELEILGRCARPVVPVLNFVADTGAKPDVWRQELARANMHVVVAFDTVVLDESSELNLYQKLRTMFDLFADQLDAVIADLTRRRAELRRTSTVLIADLMIDVAAYLLVVPGGDEPGTADALAAMKRLVRECEQRCVDELLELFRFRPGDYLSETLPIVDGKWGLDLFSPDSLVEFGVATSEAAATGALAGLAIDAMVGGMTLGTAAATGAVVGGLVGAARSRGREVFDGLRGYTELRVQDATLSLLALRQLALVRALIRRGHASQDRIRLEMLDRDAKTAPVMKRLRAGLKEIRRHPEWSRLSRFDGAVKGGRRVMVRERLAEFVGEGLA